MAATILTNIVRRTSGSRPIATEIRTIPETHPKLIAEVLTGQGTKSFIGGADIAEMAALDSPATAREFITRVHTACKSIRGCPVPVIGRINGYALGAGPEVAASCDFRVASRNAIFGMPEARSPTPGLIEWGRTRRLLMLGDTISAVEALHGPGAIRPQKKLIRQWEQLGLDNAIEAGIPAFGESFEEDGEGTQKLSAFLKSEL
ncbi:ClpP/crotonase-like domain-containing protein [Aspergillus oleicola]